jgi:uncharacterized protein
VNQSGLLFVPATWQRTGIIRWLKRVHAWTGFWGALLFLMMGVSGVLLNHRNLWVIEAGEPVEVSAMNIAVAPNLILNEKALGAWAKREFELLTEPRALFKEKDDDSEIKSFLGKPRLEAPKWIQQFNHSNGHIIIEYSPGSSSVAVHKKAENIFGFIKNLHQGHGIGLAWVLFMDSIAGALITMSLTGFLLWTRLHGSRLIAGAILITCFGFAVAAIQPYWLSLP